MQTLNILYKEHELPNLMNLKKKNVSFQKYWNPRVRGS